MLKITVDTNTLISATISKRNEFKLLSSVKGFGKKDAERVKIILISYLSKKGYLKEFNKI